MAEEGETHSCGVGRRRVYPYDNSCPFIDERQTCRGKGKSFLDWEWQPSGCDLPLFDPSRFLELLRNRIMAFVGGRIPPSSPLLLIRSFACGPSISP